jgi:glycosyltransferase involved in cell wall biosynthesis
MVVGAQSIHVHRFIAGLCEAGQRVVWVTQGAERPVAHARLIEQIDADFSMRSLATAHTIRRHLERWRPRVVHAHQASSGAWHAWRGTRGSGLPLVVTLWGSDVLRLHEWNWLYRRIVRHTLRSAAAWTADARVLLAAAQSICGPVDGIVREWIPIGIDPPPPAPAVQRERRVLSCRLHKPLYRIDAILRAFSRLPAAHSGWVLELAGSGAETAALQQLAADLGLGDRVEFTGMLSPAALAAAMRRSALFVSVPESDGTSVSLLESMAAGCLPVLSDLPANREWVEDGRNGLLVADPAALDSALLRAMQWWQSGRWDDDGGASNARLVAEKALLPNNMQQFIALYDRLSAHRR